MFFLTVTPAASSLLGTKRLMEVNRELISKAEALPVSDWVTGSVISGRYFRCGQSCVFELIKMADYGYGRYAFRLTGRLSSESPDDVPPIQEKLLVALAMAISEGCPCDN